MENSHRSCYYKTIVSRYANITKRFSTTLILFFFLLRVHAEIRKGEQFWEQKTFFYFFLQGTFRVVKRNGSVVRFMVTRIGHLALERKKCVFSKQFFYSPSSLNERLSQKRLPNWNSLASLPLRGCWQLKENSSPCCLLWPWSDLPSTGLHLLIWKNDKKHWTCNRTPKFVIQGFEKKICFQNCNNNLIEKTNHYD